MEHEVALVIRLVDGTLLRLEGLAREYASVLKRDLDHWLAPVRRIRRRNQEALERLPTAKARWDRLCELNVIEQVALPALTDANPDARRFWHGVHEYMFWFLVLLLVLPIDGLSRLLHG